MAVFIVSTETLLFFHHNWSLAVLTHRPVLIYSLMNGLKVILVIVAKSPINDGRHFCMGLSPCMMYVYLVMGQELRWALNEAKATASL